MSSKNMSSNFAGVNGRRVGRAWIVTGFDWPLGFANASFSRPSRRRRHLRGDVRRDERITPGQDDAEAVAAEAADPDDVVAVHHVGARILVGLVDQHAADAPFGHRHRQRGADLVALGIVRDRLVDELERVAGARIVDFDAGALAAAARRVDQLRRAGRVLRAGNVMRNDSLPGSSSSYCVYASCVKSRDTGALGRSDPSGLVPPGNCPPPPARCSTRAASRRSRGAAKSGSVAASSTGSTSRPPARRTFFMRAVYMKVS